MVKVILGGILAIPIAYLIVLWVFKQDPLSVGPKVGNIAPFMVPAALRDSEPEEADADGANAKAETKPEKRADELPVIPKLDPDRVLDPDLDESKL